MNRHLRAAARWGAAVILMGSVLPTAASAQSPAGPSTPAPAAPPIECWWRTSVAAVRVGEPFSLVLTCAVLENETTTIVPDETRLEAGVLQLPPFEVIGGTRAPDLRSGQRRFFQYEYSLRLISDDAFGKDVKLPSLSITYHVQRRVQGAALQGRDLTYVLPSDSIRVLAIVPADAQEVREPAPDTFSAIDARAFRANIFFAVGGVLSGLGVLMLLLTFVQLVGHRSRRAPDTDRLISDRAILSAARAELSAVRRLAQDGWTGELAGRAFGALRVAGGYASSRRISQTASRAESHDGQLTVRGGWLWSKRVLVSSAVTSAILGHEAAAEHTSPSRRQRLEALQTALSQLDAVRYGRETGAALDDAALNESLESGLALIRRLRFEHLWLVQKLDAMRASLLELGSRVWSR